MSKLKKVRACHEQYCLKADAEEVGLLTKLKGAPKEALKQAGGRKQPHGTWHAVHIPVGHPASRLPAAWLLVHYPQAFVGPRIPNLGTDLLT